MNEMKMWILRETKDSPAISLRHKHADAEADGKRLQLPKFEVVQVRVTYEDIPVEEIVNGTPVKE